MIASRPRVAWVTNDLPPRSGGIQQFVANLLERTADAGTLVIGPAVPDADTDAAARFDASGPWRTHRENGPVLPTPSITRRVVEQVVDHRPDVIVIASLWPLGRMAGALRRATHAPILGLTHGAEAGLARRGARPLLRAVTRDVDVVTVISDHTAGRIAASLPGRHLERLSPGVDPLRFRREHNADAALALRARWGVPAGVPVVGCVARLVPRKGQDVLLRAWEGIHRHHPSARLVLVGEGPMLRTFQRAAARADSVHVVGPVAFDQLPAAYAALDVFAMPVRTRRAGFDVEGLGISYLEAQAAGLPVVAGRSGGAPETITDERVGSVVDGRSVHAVAAAVDGWLSDPERRTEAARLGPGLARAWSWTAVAQRFVGLVDRLAGSHGTE